MAPVEWRSRCRLIGKSEDADLSKLLLADLSEDGVGLDAYRKYLSGTLNLNLSHATLAGSPRSVLGRFFCLDRRGPTSQSWNAPSTFA